VRKIFCYSIAFLLVFSLQAEEERGDESSAENYSGISFGVGLNIGIQRNSAEANKEFGNRSSSLNSAMYGGTVTVGWQKKVCRNLFVGIEGGVDFGSDPKGIRTGGILRNNSNIILEESYRRDLLARIMRSIAGSVKIVQLNVNNPIGIVNANPWQNLIGTFRYLGNAAGSSNADGFPSDMNVRNFIIADSNGQGVYNTLGYLPAPGGGDVSYNNAQLADFMPRVIENLREFGAHISGRNGNEALLAGIREIRDFTSARFSAFASILQNIAAGNITSPGGAAVLYGGAGNLSDNAANVIAEFIGGEIRYGRLFNFIRNLSEVGIPLGVLPGATPAEQLQSAINVILSIYNPTTGVFALPPGVTEADIRNSVQTKTSFGVCPHVAVKVGYFFNELNACLYTKIGVIQLNGQVTPVNNLYNIREEKFRKITPFVAIGGTKNIDDNWGIAVELAHAFKVKKKLRDIRIFNRYTIENSATVSRTNLRVMLIYKL
jgi:hypothetical protein